MVQLDNKLEEIRTICRLHGCPTGRWEDLADLPLRLSQDAGLRSYLVEIVRSLQLNNVSLPEALDLVVVAVGGESAPRHTRDLSEQLNLLGGFLASIGRWPGDDARPILAPGEVPENLHQFIRPRPRTPAQPPPTQETQAPAAQVPEAHTPDAHTSEAQIPDAQPQEAQHPEPQPAQAEQPSTPVPPQPVAEPRRPRYVAQPQTADAQLPPEIFRTTAQPAAPRNPAPEPETPSSPAADIARALARLERGNLELRAHLDSIDQRISRMEPLLEAGTPPDSPHPLPEPDQAAPSSDPVPAHTPILIHRNPPSSKSSRASWPTPSTADPADSARAEFHRPEQVTARPIAADTPSSKSHLIPIPAQRPADPGAPATKSRSTEPTPFAPRFSRFPNQPGPIPAQPLSSTAQTDPAPLPAVAISSVSLPSDPRPSSANLRPGLLPQGFLGTEPTPLEAAAADLPDPPLHRRSRHFALVATLLILLGLVGGAFLLYTRTLGVADESSTGISPNAAPATSSGPLTATPTGSAAAAPEVPGRVLGARTAFQPHQTAEVPGSSSGFRPASTFVPSGVMDGHLISAPLPNQSRITPSARGSGVVVMEANISKSGQVEDVHILGGNTALRSAAIDAVRNWQYKPYLLNGNPVEIRTIIRVDFAERHSQPADRGAPFPS